MSARLNPDHADDTGILDGLPVNGRWGTDSPINGIITDFCIKQRNGIFAIGFGTIRAGNAEPFTVYNLSGSGMRDLRGLIDRALGDRT